MAAIKLPEEDDQTLPSPVFCHQAAVDLLYNLMLLTQPHNFFCFQTSSSFPFAAVGRSTVASCFEYLTEFCQNTTSATNTTKMLD